MQIDRKFWVCADYPHIRIPKRLLSAPEYKMVKLEAKVVYGAMLDRTNLSRKNRDKFTNKDNELIIYFPQGEVMQLLGCSHDKATKMIKDLVEAGLIKVKRHGIGRPYEIVLTPIDWRTQRETKNESSGNSRQDSGKSDDSFCGKTDGNNTELSNPDINDPEIGVRRYIQGIIEYEALTKKFGASLVDRVLAVVVNTIGQDTAEYLIGDTYIPGEVLREELRNLNQDCLANAINKIRRATYTKNHSDVFILNALYEAITYQ